MDEVSPLAGGVVTGHSPKYIRAAELVRARIADGTLRPGESAPSGAALAVLTGYSVLTCRRALRVLVKDGTLGPGPSPSARPRVPVPASSPAGQALAQASRALSAGLASRRRAAGLTQPALAVLVGCSLTTVGHAETGRLWQGRDFWERADKQLSAEGQLLALHDAYRAAGASADPATPAEVIATAAIADTPSTVAVGAAGPVASVTITWADGTATTVYPPPPDDLVPVDDGQCTASDDPGP